MRIFKNKAISKFAVKHGISNQELIDAVARAEQGLIDADLGGGVIKQRIARTGQGKSGGYRSIIFFKQGDKAFFMMAFAKSNRENITHRELAELKQSARVILALSDAALAAAISNETFTEITP